jgi:hypothetical protein
LDKVKSGERTAADVVQCNEVFKEMETEARFIRKSGLTPRRIFGSSLPSGGSSENIFYYSRP